MLTNIALINKIADEKKLTFISTGMSNYSDIDRAIKIFKKNCKFVVMHTVSLSLPENKLNLKMMSFKTKI